METATQESASGYTDAEALSGMPAEGKLDLSPEEIREDSAAELFDALSSNEKGLGGEEAARRLDAFGPNAIEEKNRNPLLKFLGYFWGPIPWMIEVAAILSGVVQDWTNLTIILLMLLFNAVVGFWQEFQADNAVEALKGELAMEARVLRDGEWGKIPSRELVPGDVIRLRIGDVVPADTKLVSGDYLSVDESALTGESLPVEKEKGAVAFSGSTVKHGEMEALVVATGAGTRFAKTAKLVESAGNESHFQKAVLAIGDYLIYLSLGLAAVLIVSQLVRGDSFLSVFQFVLILVVAAIPVAMPAVLSVTMALGALSLSRMKAIVSKLQSIEEIAGIDILCSDKTGTLTQNQLTLGDPIPFAAADERELVLAAALASAREERDPIDQAVADGLEEDQSIDGYGLQNFLPFNPTDKRTEATIQGPNGGIFKVSKGAPQVIFKLCDLRGKNREKAEKRVNELARRDTGPWAWPAPTETTIPGPFRASSRCSIRPGKIPRKPSARPWSTASTLKW
jgi:H+-transporting ATPase